MTFSEVLRTTAVDVFSKPGLKITEYFGAASTGDPNVSACLATVDRPSGAAHQTPEFDQYILVVSGSVHVVHSDETVVLGAGQGVVLPAGRRVQWAWPEPCQYVILCLPGLATRSSCTSPSVTSSASPSAAATPPPGAQQRPCYELPSRRLSKASAKGASEAVRGKAAAHGRPPLMTSPLARRAPTPVPASEASLLAGNLARRCSSPLPCRVLRPGEGETAEGLEYRLPADDLTGMGSLTELAPARSTGKYSPGRVSPSSPKAVGSVMPAPAAPALTQGTAAQEVPPLVPQGPAEDLAVPPQGVAAPSAPGTGGQAPESRQPPCVPPVRHGLGRIATEAWSAAQGPKSVVPTQNPIPCGSETTTEGEDTSCRAPATVESPRALHLRVARALQRLPSDDDSSERSRDQTSVECEERPARYGARHLNTPVVIVASELHPWSKTGGLAMVTAAYAYEFAARGHRTMVVSPRYGEYEGCEYAGIGKVWLDGQLHEVRYFHQRREFGAGKACDYVFVDHHCYRREGLYGDPARGGEYEDNLFRFALLSVAAAEAPLVLGLGGSLYGQEVCFLANDWQTGLLPLYLLYKYKRNQTYRKARCILVLHNLGYQGRFRKSKHPLDKFLGLPLEAAAELQGEDAHLGLDCLNVLGAGIKCADRVLTVSPNYAKEIQTPEGGFGLHLPLREKATALRVAGILNGISDEWSPVRDPHIARRYGLTDFEECRRECKAALQRELGLRQDPDVAVLGFCGRLCFQKGVHLITSIIPWLMHDQGNGVNGRVQVVLMGKGDAGNERQLRGAEATSPGRVCGYVGFSPVVEHRMMAGCDLLLMPSQYEPCGLPQMYAQQYGALPVAHKTGGLHDSIIDLADEERDLSLATGFLFTGFDANSLKERLYTALDIFFNRRPVFRRMQENAMQSSFYWPRAIDEYERHIDFTMEDVPCRS